MEQWRIELFKEHFADTEIPWSRTVEPDEKVDLYGRVTRSVVGANVHYEKQWRWLTAQTPDLVDINDDEAPFCPLLDILRSHDLEPPRTVYIDYRESRIVREMKFTDVEQYFDILATADEAMVGFFDESARWYIALKTSGRMCIRTASMTRPNFRRERWKGRRTPQPQTPTMTIVPTRDKLRTAA